MSNNELNRVLDELALVSKQLGYQVYPGYIGEQPRYDFGRSIGQDLHDFWTQYLEFVSTMDGFNIDGFSFYGVKSYHGEHNCLLVFNDELKGIDDGVIPGLILIGTTGTDWFVFNTFKQTWECRDRIAIDDIYESYADLSGLLNSVTERIKAANDINS